LKGGEIVKISKKLLVAIMGLAMISVTGLAALNDTWTSCTIQMHASTAATVSLAQFEDCLQTIPLNTYDWGGVAQGETYQMEYYVMNTGTLGLWITYLPTQVDLGDPQIDMVIICTIIEWGNVPCQVSGTLSEPMLEKDPTAPDQGYFLGPGKWVKIRVELTANSLISGATYDFDFAIHGVQTSAENEEP
jgi:hypothetical protein